MEITGKWQYLGGLNKTRLQQEVMLTLLYYPDTWKPKVTDVDALAEAYNLDIPNTESEKVIFFQEVFAKALKKQVDEILKSFNLE